MTLKKFNLPYLLLFSLLLCCTIGAAQTKTDSLDLAQLYAQAKIEYQAYEAKHGHYIQTENVKMHYLTWGDPNDLPFVWAHGTGRNAYELTYFVDSILAMGCYLIAIDYYGHGQTPYPEQEVTVYHLADDIKFLLDDLEIEKALIGGWSRGGSISSAFYDEYPDRCLGIVLEDGGSVNWRKPYHRLGMDTTSARMEDLFASWKPRPSFPSQEEAYAHFRRKSDSTSQFRLLNSITKSPENEWSYHPGLSEWLEEASAEGIMRALFTPTLTTLFQYSTVNLEPRIIYRNLDIPLLILDPRNERDWRMDFTTDNKALADLHPDLITHSIYENTSHAVKYRQPEKFLKDLTQFVQKVRQFHDLEKIVND